MFYFHANCLQNKRIEWMNGIFGLESDCEVFSHSNWSQKLLDQFVIFFFGLISDINLNVLMISWQFLKFENFRNMLDIWRSLLYKFLPTNEEISFTSFLIRRERTHFSSLNLWILYGMEKVCFNIQFWRFDICRKKW